MIENQEKPKHKHSQNIEVNHEFSLFILKNLRKN